MFMMLEDGSLIKDINICNEVVETAGERSNGSGEISNLK